MWRYDHLSQEEILNLGKQTLAAQPFSQLVGAKLTTFKEGEVVFEIPIRDELLQHHGFVHGGVLSFAADNALTFFGGTVLGPAIITSEYKINYLKPGIGETIIARAYTVSSGNRQAACRCGILVVKDSEEKVCGMAQGMIVTFNDERR